MGTITEHSYACPYPGLRPFTEDEGHLFFGREKQIEEMLENLEEHRFLAVIGASGCGKSSLVRAGLLPVLQEGFLSGASQHWRMAVMRPGDSPFDRLTAALLTETALAPERSADPKDAGMLQASLRRGPLGLVESVIESHLPDETNLLLVVDQFEEIFRYRRQTKHPEDADSFVRLLLASVEPNVSTRLASDRLAIYVIITMRSDYIGDCALFSGLPEAINAGLFLTPRLSRSDYRAAIVEPARVGGGSLDPRLINQLLNDMRAEPDQLPVLQHALMRMWTKAAMAREAETGEMHSLGGGTEIELTLQQYEDVGRLGKALSRHADETLAELDSSQQHLAEVMFRCLCERGADQRDTRRPARLREIAEVAEVSAERLKPIVECFRRFDRSFLMPAAPTKLEDETVLDISHESLIRQWDALKQWVVSEASRAEIYTRLDSAAQRREKHQGELWRGADLSLALNWQKKASPTAAWATRYGGNYPLAMTFLAESAQESDREAKEKEEARRKELEEQRQRAEEQTRIARRFRSYTYGLGALALLLIVLGAFTLISVLESQTLRQLQMVNELVDRSEIEAESNTELGMLSALVALELAHPPEPGFFGNLPFFSFAELSDKRVQVISALAELVSGFHLTLLGHSRDVNTIAFSPSGKFIASAGDDKMVKLWDSQTGKQLRNLRGHFGPVKYIEFSPSGKILVTASDDKSALLWDLSDAHRAKKKLRLSGHTQAVNHASFSRDGKRIATASNDNTVKVWGIDSEKPLFDLRGHTDEVRVVRFGPKGDKLATASKDGTVRIWDAALEKAKILKAHDGGAWDVDFAPTGELLASVGRDNRLKLWNIKTGELLEEVKAKTELKRVAFSPDGRHVFAAGDYDTEFAQIVGAVVSGNSITSISFPKHDELSKDPVKRKTETHTDDILDIQVSEDNRYLATASADGTAKIWDLSTQTLVDSFDKHKNEIYAVMFDPEGSRLATASRDTTVKIWNWKEEFKYYLLQAPKTTDFVFSSDGARLITRNREGSVTIWNTSTGAEVATLTNKKALRRKLILSPDGTHLITQNPEGIVTNWNASTGAEVATLTEKMARGTSLALSPDGARLITQNPEGSVTIWNASTGAEVATLAEKMARGTSLTISPDGARLITRTPEGSVTIWNASNGAEVATLNEKLALRRSFTLSPDGARLITQNPEGSVMIWNTSTGAEVATLAEKMARGTSLALSPDGTRLVTRTPEGSVTIWNASNGVDMATLTEKMTRGTSLTLSPDGALLVTGTPKRSVTIWNTLTGAEVATLTEEMERLTLSPDGARLAVIDSKGMFKLWELDAEAEAADKKLIAFAREKARRKFTFKECERLPAKLKECEEMRQIAEINALVDLNTNEEALRKFKAILAQASEPAKLKTALGLDPILTPENAASILVASQLFNLAEKQLQQRNYNKMEKLFNAAQKIFPDYLEIDKNSLNINPAKLLSKMTESKIRKLRRSDVSDEDLKEIIETLERTYQLDDQLEGLWTLANNLCWTFGVEKNKAEVVMDACEMAFELDPEDGGIRDTLAVARALTFDLSKDKKMKAEVIEAFEYYVKWGKGKRSLRRIERREKWIEELNQGINPFDETHRKKTLSELRYD